MSSIKNLRSGVAPCKDSGESVLPDTNLVWRWNAVSRLESYGGKFDLNDSNKPANQKQVAKESRYR